MSELSDDEWQEAKDRLQAAITAYYSETQPDVYVSAWALVTHKESIDMEQAGESAVGLLVPTGQSFPMSRGILEVALDAEKASHSPREGT